MRGWDVCSCFFLCLLSLCRGSNGACVELKILILSQADLRNSSWGARLYHPMPALFWSTLRACSVLHHIPSRRDRQCWVASHLPDRVPSTEGALPSGFAAVRFVGIYLLGEIHAASQGCWIGRQRKGRLTHLPDVAAASICRKHNQARTLRRHCPHPAVSVTGDESVTGNRRAARLSESKRQGVRWRAIEQVRVNG